MTFLRHDHLVKKDILRRNHFEIWTICNNNLFETWHFWDMTFLRQELFEAWSFLDQNKKKKLIRLFSGDELELNFCELSKISACFWQIWIPLKPSLVNSKPNITNFDKMNFPINKIHWIVLNYHHHGTDCWAHRKWKDFFSDQIM